MPNIMFRQQADGLYCYIAKRDSTLEAELQKAAQRLYEKVVPAAVQEYISDCTQDDPVRKPQKKSEAQV